MPVHFKRCAHESWKGHDYRDSTGVRWTEYKCVSCGVIKRDRCKS